MSQKKLSKRDKSALKHELRDYDQSGISLVLDGYPSSPGKIAKSCCLAEEGSYMRDYMIDEKGVVYEVHFNLVKNL